MKRPPLPPALLWTGIPVLALAWLLAAAPPWTLAGTALGPLSQGAPTATTTPTLIWATKASMPAARNYLGVAAGLDGKVYAAGGNTGSGAVTTVEAYDATTNAGAAKAPMTTARTNFGLAGASNGKLYVVGGTDVSANLATVEEATIISPPAATVRIEGFQFQPANVTIGVGGTVLWTNYDGVAHSVTGSAASLNSGSLGGSSGGNPGGSFQFQFLAAGTYTYQSAAYPAMQGTITVLDSLSESASVSGTVGNSSFQLLPGATARLWLRPSSGAARIIKEATTAADGSFTLGGLLPSAKLPSGDYVLSAVKAGAYEQWYSGQSNLAAGQAIVLTAGGSVTGRNFVLSDLPTATPTITPTVSPTATPALVWTTRASMPTPLSGHGVAAVSGRIHAVGGDDSGEQHVGTLEEYDPPTNTWTVQAADAPAAELPGRRGDPKRQDLCHRRPEQREHAGRPRG